MSHDDHHHHHHSDHDAIEAPDTSNSDTALLADALRLVLIDKGVFSAHDVQDQLSLMDTRSDRNGAAMVARAWVDADYRAAMMADSAAAAKTLGYDTKGTPLVVLENTNDVHNVIVCTLCSCYPRHAAWAFAGVVQVQSLPRSRGPGSALGAARVRNRHRR